jgi:hypothetical protein
MKLKNNINYIATSAKVFMTALILLLALLIIQSIIVETERTFASTKHRQEPKPAAELTPEEQQINRIKYSEKEFLPDGTIHLVYRPERTWVRRDKPEIMQIYDANDKLIWQGPISRRPHYSHLSWAEQLNSYRRDFTQQRMRQLQMITPELSRTLEVPVQSEQQVIQIWRYNPAKNYFIGYDTDGKRIGYIGSTGFTNSIAETKSLGKFRSFTAWCPQDSFSPTLLWRTQRCIYQIDFEKQKVELLFESTDSDIEMMSQHAWKDIAPDKEGSTDYETYRPLLHFITKDSKHHLIMREPKQQFTITPPEDWKNWFGNSYQFTATRQAIFMRRSWIESRRPPEYSKSPKLYMEWGRNFRSQPQKYWVELYKVDNQGSLESLNRYTWTVPRRSESVKLTEYRMIMPSIVNKFSPPLYDWLWHLSGIKFWMQRYHRNDLAYEFASMVRDIRPGDSAINWLLSVAMMCFAFWHGWPRRKSWPKFLFWLAFVGIFNLAGLLTYLALNHVTVIKCPACGKSRGLTKVNCIRCGVELPAPKRGKLDLIFNS